MFWPNLNSIASTIPEITAIEFWVGVANPQSWGRGGCRESGTVLFERTLMSSYRPFIVTFHLSLHVSDILPLKWMAFGLRRLKVMG